MNFSTLNRGEYRVVQHGAFAVRRPKVHADVAAELSKSAHRERNNGRRVTTRKTRIK